MRTLLLSLFAVALIARPASADSDADARAALALAKHLPPQAPLPQQAPPVDGKTLCPCHGAADCTCVAGGCGCGPCGMTYEWKGFANDAGQIALFLDGKQVGGYNLVTGIYRPVNAATAEWGKPCRPPTIPPLKAPPARRPPLTLEFAPQSFTPPPQYFAPPVQFWGVQTFGASACVGGSCSGGSGGGRRR